MSVRCLRCASPHAFVRVLAAAACAVTLAAAAHADDAIVTDRPDFVESSAVVGAGRVQIETGYARERDVDAAGTRARSRSTPTLVRVGVGERTEVRLETDAWSRLSVQDASGAFTRERGFADVSLGVKWHQRDDDEATGAPAIAWLAHVDVDSGSAAFRGDGLRPSLRVVAEWELPRDWSLGVMTGLFVERDAERRRFVGGILAATAGYAWTPQLRTFVEVAGEQIARAPRRLGGHGRRGRRLPDRLLDAGRRRLVARPERQRAGPALDRRLLRALLSAAPCAPTRTLQASS